MTSTLPSIQDRSDLWSIGAGAHTTGRPPGRSMLLHVDRTLQMCACSAACTKKRYKDRISAGRNGVCSMILIPP